MADKVGLLDRGIKIGIACQPSIILILVIVAITISIEECGVELPTTTKAMVYNKLIIKLKVVISLVIVVVNVRTVGQYKWAIRGDVLTRSVVATTIALHILARDTIISEIGARRATKRQELHLGIRAIISRLKHI